VGALKTRRPGPDATTRTHVPPRSTTTTGRMDPLVARPRFMGAIVARRASKTKAGYSGEYTPAEAVLSDRSEIRGDPDRGGTMRRTLMNLTAALLAGLAAATAAQAMTPTETVKSRVDEAIQGLGQTPSATAESAERRRTEIRRAA